MSEKKLMLSLDLGTRMGYVVGEINALKVIDSGMVDFFKKNGTDGEFYIACRDFLEDLASKYDFSHCAYEKVAAHHGVLAAHKYGAYEALLEMWAVIHGVELIYQYPPTIKKRVTGNGKAKKDEMLTEITKFFPDIKPTAHDHADALGVYLSCRGTIHDKT